MLFAFVQIAVQDRGPNHQVVPIFWGQIHDESEDGCKLANLNCFATIDILTVHSLVQHDAFGIGAAWCI